MGSWRNCGLAAFPRADGCAVESYAIKSLPVENIFVYIGFRNSNRTAIQPVLNFLGFFRVVLRLDSETVFHGAIYLDTARLLR